MILPSRARFILFGILCLACSDSPVEPESNLPISLAVVGGEGQVGMVGEMLGSPVAVVVRRNGSPVPNVLVNFVVTEGGGSVFAPAVLTDGNGRARNWWTLGTRAGPDHVIELRTMEGRRAVVRGTLHATATPGPAADVQQRQESHYSPEDTVLTNVGARITDRWGNGVAGHRFVFETTGAAKGMEYDTVVSDADGLAMANWRMPRYSSTDSIQEIRGRPLPFIAEAFMGGVVEMMTFVYPTSGLSHRHAGPNPQVVAGYVYERCFRLERSGVVVEPHRHHRYAAIWRRDLVVDTHVTNAVSAPGDSYGMCYEFRPPTTPGEYEYVGAIPGVAGEWRFTIQVDPAP